MNYVKLCLLKKIIFRETLCSCYYCWINITSELGNLKDTFYFAHDLSTGNFSRAQKGCSYLGSLVHLQSGVGWGHKHGWRVARLDIMTAHSQLAVGATLTVSSAVLFPGVPGGLSSMVVSMKTNFLCSPWLLPDPMSQKNWVSAV